MEASNNPELVADLPPLKSGSVHWTDQRRLQASIQLDLLTVLVAVTGLAALRLWVVPSNWLVVIIAACLALSACLRRARSLVMRHRYVAAILSVVVSKWAVMVVAVAIVPFALVLLPPLLLVAGLPGVQRLSRLQLSAVLGGTIVVAAAIATGVGRYDPEVELTVYFCCMEALQNAIKHAGEQATVTITLRDDHGLTFDVQDTGRGCDPLSCRVTGSRT